MSTCFVGTALVGAQAQKAETFTGCLNPSDEAGLLLLTVYEEGKEADTIRVMRNEDVAKHAQNHTVELTGRLIEKDGVDVLQVDSVKHVAATCQTGTTD